MCLAAVTVVSSLKRAVIKFDELVKLTVAAAQDISTLLKDREQRLSDAESATHAAASVQPRRSRKAARATAGRGRVRTAAV
jgi:hypothetical protein